MTPPFTRCRQQTRIAVMEELRRLLPRMEGLPPQARVLALGVAALDSHLPQGGLAFGALHEIAPATDGDLPSAFGFIAALLGRFPGGPLMWIMSARSFAQYGRPYGHGLNHVGLDPGRLILVETSEGKQTLWAMEEALRSTAPAAVAGVIDELDLKTSQRLQLAARESGLPLLLLRPARTFEASVAATRWRVGAVKAARDRFGLIIGWRWHLRLERCRNGRPGEWLVEFDHGAHRFSLVPALADPALAREPGAQSLRIA
jgi:protein ImuA